MSFKMHKNYIFFQKKKYVCLSYLKFSDLLPETYLFLFGLTVHQAELQKTVFFIYFFYFSTKARKYSQFYAYTVKPVLSSHLKID